MDASYQGLWHTMLSRAFFTGATATARASSGSAAGAGPAKVAGAKARRAKRAVY